MLVGRPDLLNQRFRRVIGHDVVVLGDRMQDRHLDAGNIRRPSTHRHRVVVELIVPHQVLGDGSEILAGKRQGVRRPAIEHAVRLDVFVVPDVFP